MKRFYNTPATSEVRMSLTKVICSSAPAPAPGRNSAGSLMRTEEQNVW